MPDSSILQGGTKKLGIISSNLPKLKLRYPEYIPPIMVLTLLYGKPLGETISGGRFQEFKCLGENLESGEPE